MIPVGNESIEVDLPQSVILTDPLDESKTAVEVRTWGQVVVYGLNGNDAEAFLALPTPVMGMEYFLVGSMSSGLPGESGSFFVLMGIYDDTFVSLKVRGSLIFRNDLHKAGSSVEFTINRHQALYLVSFDDQTGTHILASKPISVMSGSTCGFRDFPGASAEQPLCGPMIEHLPPVERWGREFVVPAFQGNDRRSTSTYIMASREGTSLKVNDGALVTLAPGYIHEINASEAGVANAFISANKPILVYQMIEVRPLGDKAGLSTTSLTIVPNVDEVENHPLLQDIYIPLPNVDHYGHNDSLGFFNLVAPCSSTSNVTINGESLQDDDWSSAVSISHFCVATEAMVPGKNYRIEPHGSRVSVLLSGFSLLSGYSCPGNL